MKKVTRNPHSWFAMVDGVEYPVVHAHNIDWKTRTFTRDDLESGGLKKNGKANKHLRDQINRILAGSPVIVAVVRDASGKRLKKPSYSAVWPTSEATYSESVMSFRLGAPLIRL